MRKAYNEYGRSKNVEVKEFDHRILSDKAFELMEVSDFHIYVDNNGVYYMNHYENDIMEKVGSLEDLNETLESYADECIED